MSDLRSIPYRLVSGTSIALSLFAGALSLPAAEAAPPFPSEYAYPSYEASPYAFDTIWLAAYENEMLAEHNRLRAAVGAGALSIDPQLERLARERAADMVSQRYFSHYSPSGQTVFDLMDAAGFVAYSSAENIATNNYPGEQSVNAAMTGFMESTGHRESLLNPQFTRVGIGYGATPDGWHYFAVVFATP